MDYIESDDNFIQELEIAETIANFIKNRQRSFKEISKISGISPTNLSKVLSGKTSLSLPYFVRIAAAAGNDEIYDWVFDIPIKKYLSQAVKMTNSCSTTDYVYFLILTRDYFINNNKNDTESILNKVFYKLTQSLVQNQPNRADENLLATQTSIFVQQICNSFYDDQSLLHIRTRMDMISDHRIGILMNEGNAIIWDDVRNLIAYFLMENRNFRLSPALRNLLNRITYKKIEAYKVSNLLLADNEMKMNGIFFSACCLAAKNDILSSKVCNLNSETSSGLREKLRFGTASFFSCIRSMNLIHGRNQNVLDFWKFFRQTAADSPYHMAQLRSIIESSPELFPRNPLKYYQERC